VKRDHLPLVVEHRRAAASLRRVALVDQDIGQIVVDDFIVAQRDLLFLAVGVLNDGRVVARARLSQPAIQDEVALVAQIAQAGHIARANGDQGQVQRLRGVQEGFRVQRMDHRLAQLAERVVFVAELDAGIIGQRGEFTARVGGQRRAGSSKVSPRSTSITVRLATVAGGPAVSPTGRRAKTCCASAWR